MLEIISIVGRTERSDGWDKTKSPVLSAWFFLGDLLRLQVLLVSDSFLLPRGHSVLEQMLQSLLFIGWSFLRHLAVI